LCGRHLGRDNRQEVDEAVVLPEAPGAREVGALEKQEMIEMIEFYYWFRGLPTTSEVGWKT
jgi:hypothetical protein